MRLSYMKQAALAVALLASAGAGARAYNPQAQDVDEQADAKLDSGDYAGAVEDYQRALEIDPGDAQAYMGIGFAKYKLGDNAAALANYNRAIELKPRFSSAYIHRAYSLLDAGNAEAAVADCDKAVQLEPISVQGCRELYRKAGVQRGE